MSFSEDYMELWKKGFCILMYPVIFLLVVIGGVMFTMAFPLMAGVLAIIIIIATFPWFIGMLDQGLDSDDNDVL